MSIALIRRDDSDVLEVALSGTLTHQDYEHFMPEVETMVRKHGKIRLLLRMEDFHGWNAMAMWDDTKFAFKHYSDISRIAMVGETRWERWMSAVCKPFTRAEVRYYERPQMDEARHWIGAPGEGMGTRQVAMEEVGPPGVG